MASDFVGRIHNRQEIKGVPDSSGPAAPNISGDPALSRLQSLSEASQTQIQKSDGSQISREVHGELMTSQSQFEAQQTQPKRQWNSPKVARALALGGMLVGCAAGAFALGGAGFFLAMAAEALAFAGGMLVKNAALSELEEENRRLREKSTRDPLMGINNRGAIDEILEEQLQRAPFRSSAVSVIMADVDHFKSVNDTYGHQVGDEVLIEVALRVEEGMRAEDSLGRYGGEEFLMVLPGIGGAQAVLIAHRIRLLIAEHPFDTEAGDLDITMSLGVSCTQYPEIVGAENLVKAADQALYRAKHEGRNRVVLSMVGEQPGLSN
jgi:diguanylate cyclase (GGDEF)-like protein